MKLFILCSTLVSNVKAALVCASTDKTRPQLNCVRIEVSGTRARFVSTDGHCLWVNECSAAEGSETGAIQIAAEDAKSLIKMLAKEPGEVVLSVTDNNAVEARTGSQSFTFRNVDATFPPYAQVFPDVVGPEAFRPCAQSSFDAFLIARAASAFGAIANSKCGVSVCVLTCGSLPKERKNGQEVDGKPERALTEPGVIVSSASNCGEAIMIVMPMRASETPVADARRLVAHYKGGPGVAKAGPAEAAAE